MYDLIISAPFLLGTSIALILSVIGLFALDNHEKAKYWLSVSLMISMLLVVLSVILSKRQQNMEKTLYNAQAVIVSINGSETYITQDKFHTPMACAAILFKTLEGNLFQVDCASARTPDMKYVVSPQWVYSHNVGDTVFFEYISKTRFIPSRKD